MTHAGFEGFQHSIERARGDQAEALDIYLGSVLSGHFVFSISLMTNAFARRRKNIEIYLNALVHRDVNTAGAMK